jgi:hypothetical protein
VVPGRGALPSSSGSPADEGPAPAGFEWAPLSTIAIDAIDARGSAVALDEMLPPPQDTADRHHPWRAQPVNVPRRAYPVPSRRWTFALAVVFAVVVVALVRWETPGRAFRTIASAADRRLAALFTPVAVTLVPGARTDIGTISATAVPWADILVDGHWIGRTPVTDMRVVVGRHRLTFSHPDFGEIETITVVTANETAYATVYFAAPN